MLFKYHFILKEKKSKKESILPECYLCIKHFGSYIWLIHFCSPVAVLELKVDFINANGNIELSLPVVEDFFKDTQLCYPKHRRRLMSDCGMKVNVRIKENDILSAFSLFFGSCFVSFKAVYGFFWPLGGSGASRKPNIDLLSLYKVVTLSDNCNCLHILQTLGNISIHLERCFWQPIEC